MSEKWDQKYAMKNAHWEQAKGHLRAMVAIDGALSSETDRPARFEVVSEAIEKFVTEFEDNGLHE